MKEVITLITLIDHIHLFICSDSPSQPAERKYPQASAVALWVNGYLRGEGSFVFRLDTITFVPSV